MNREELEELKEINNNLEEIWHRLDTIQYYIRDIAEHGIIETEIKDSIIAIARALNKKFDKEWKNMENSPGAKV